jgi:predicted nuclease with TOPRIM domain
LANAVSKFQGLLKSYQEKTSNYKEEIGKLRKKYENTKMENVDLLVEKEKKMSEIETLSKKNEFVQDYFKNLLCTSQNYLEKIENYKLSIDDFFKKFNNSISIF